jgi:hypothetical protein
MGWLVDEAASVDVFQVVREPPGEKTNVGFAWQKKPCRTAVSRPYVRLLWLWYAATEVEQQQHQRDCFSGWAAM